ncbi:MAG TPA: hypothetical protein VFW78_03620 [Bacteroidia bacterium]|nr:hypothetical protein [Bacteroidia bacterium]
MDYNIKEHGDWLEKQAADYINTNIPAYELIWKSLIGHKGNGQMATMQNLNDSAARTRVDFAQHHYTILESLYFMQLMADDENKIKTIISFEQYRIVINQIMSFQAYSGRLRDNIGECFFLIAPKEEAEKAIKKLEEFYNERHIYIHGRKVPFSIDADNIFKIALVKRSTISSTGFGKDMPWESISDKEMNYLTDTFNKSLTELKPLVQGLLSNLYQFVNKFIHKSGGKLIFGYSANLESPISSSINPAPSASAYFPDINSSGGNYLS